jgi:hypothetical protein
MRAGVQITPGGAMTTDTRAAEQRMKSLEITLAAAPR